jgi:MFS transporter, DHA2 family, multidrug resistance protein
VTFRSQADRRLMLSLATVLCTLLFTIDSTIVNVALPHMRGSLQATQDQIAWVLTSYIVVGAIATPLAGWLGSRFGLRRVLTISVVGFTLGSVACGFATDLGEMVAFRMVQGLFGAALVPLAQVALMQEYPPEQHGRVMALWTMGVLVGPIIGPTLGGYLTDVLSWRWAFFINVPIGLLAYFGLLEGLAAGHDDHSRPFDWTGFVLLSLTLGLFQLMMDRGQTLDWFESTEVVAEGFFAGVLCFMFVVHSATSRHAFVDPSLFRDRNFLVAIALMFIIGLSILSPAVLLPSFLQSLQGYTPTQAGTLQAVRGASSIVAVMVAGRLVGRVDPRYLVGAGVLFAATSLWLFGGFSLDTPRSQVILTGIVQGFGTPLVFVPLSVIAYSTLRAAQRAEAGAILTLVRNVGSTIGISAAVAILARSTQVNTSYLGEHFSVYDVQRWQATGVIPGANPGTAQLLGEIERQAAAIAYANDFHLMALATIIVLPLVWLLTPPRGKPATAVEVGEMV